MIKLDEIFPVEALAPVAGGAIIWFAANWSFLAPEVIGPRLAEKYYTPACLAAVQDGRAAHAEKRRTLIEAGRQKVDQATDEFRRQAAGQVSAFWGTLLGGHDRQGQAVLNQHGATLNSWGNPAIAAAAREFRQRQSLAVAAEIAQYDKEAAAGILHSAPAQYCRCVVSVGFKDRIELAAYTATLRLYTTETISRLKDGTMLHEAPSCGKTPIV